MKDTKKWVKQLVKEGFRKNEESAKIRTHVINSTIIHDKNNLIKGFKRKLKPALNKLPERAVKLFNYTKYIYWKTESKRNTPIMALKRKNLIYTNQKQGSFTPRYKEDR